MKKISPLKKKLWKLVSEYLRLKYPACQICDKNKSTQVHHIVTRAVGGNVLYFDERNLLAVCYKCHNDIGGKGKLDFEEIIRLLISIIGLETYQYLRQKKNESKKFTVDELQGMIEEYENKIRKI